jgi:hypothetical protein
VLRRNAARLIALALPDGEVTLSGAPERTARGAVVTVTSQPATGSTK